MTRGRSWREEGVARLAPAFVLAIAIGACAPSQAGPRAEGIDAAWVGPSAQPIGATATGVDPVRGAGGAPSDALGDVGRVGSTAGDGRDDSEGIVEPDPGSVRPPRRRVVSIELRDAPLDEVLGFLADAGGFGLVLEPTATGPVNVSLHRVEPFDALVTLAESNGLRVRYLNGVAVVAPP